MDGLLVVKLSEVIRQVENLRQCCGTVLDPYSGALWIWIRIPNSEQDPGPHCYLSRPDGLN